MTPMRQRRRQRLRLRRRRLRRQLRRRRTTIRRSTTSCSASARPSRPSSSVRRVVARARRVVLDRGPPPRLRAARLRRVRARLPSLQAEYYVDRGFVTKYIQTEPTEGRQALEVLLGLDAARSLDDFAARRTNSRGRTSTPRPTRRAASARAPLASVARRIRGSSARGARRTYVVRAHVSKITCTPARAPFASPRAEGR